MGGGLMQLIAYGAQDVYLTGNPTITFFKIVYKRHTNFAIEAIEQNVVGEENFGSEFSCNINFNGDLITKMYIKCNVSLTGSNGKFAWVSKLGHSLLIDIEFLIGGSKIDKQYGDWLNIWYELARNVSHDRGYSKLIGDDPHMNTLSTEEKSATLYIPLKFFFNKFDGLAIPLISLQNTNISFIFNIRNKNELIIKERSANVNASISNISLLCNYVFLDNEERQRFASSIHEYLIEQVQFSGKENVNSNQETYTLNFSHPCKSLYWLMKNGNFISGLYFLSYIPESTQINRKGFNNNIDLKNIASIRYVLTQMYSLNGIVNLFLNGTGETIANSQTTNTIYEANMITSKDGKVSIRANYNSLNINTTNNTATCSVNDYSSWEVVKSLEIDDVSTPINILLSGIARTTDTLNLGHSNYDVSIYQWNNYGTYLDGTNNPIKNSILSLNGHLRFSEQDSEFFNYLQPYETHNCTPKDGINVYSFALNPLDHQPSGTCNFSRIDVSTLELKFDNNIISTSNNELTFYTLNYNILRIMEGIGAIAFST